MLRTKSCTMNKIRGGSFWGINSFYFGGINTRVSGQKASKWNLLSTTFLCYSNTNYSSRADNHNWRNFDNRRNLWYIITDFS